MKDVFFKTFDKDGNKITLFYEDEIKREIRVHKEKKKYEQSQILIKRVWGQVKNLGIEFLVERYKQGTLTILELEPITYIKEENHCKYDNRKEIVLNKTEIKIILRSAIEVERIEIQKSCEGFKEKTKIKIGKLDDIEGLLSQRKL